MTRRDMAATNIHPYIMDMWWPWAPWGLIFYAGRALESGRPVFFLATAAVIVGLLIWKKPPGWIWLSIATALLGIILACLSGDRRR